MTATYVSVAAGETLLVMVEVTPGGGMYTAPATINLQRSLELTANAVETKVPRTDTPSAPMKTQRVVDSVDWKCAGQGILNVGDDLVWANWLLSGATKNVQITDANTGGIVLTGPAVLTQFSTQSDGIGKRVTASIQLMGADIPTVTTHA